MNIIGPQNLLLVVKGTKPGRGSSDEPKLCSSSLPMVTFPCSKIFFQTADNPPPPKPKLLLNKNKQI